MRKAIVHIGHGKTGTSSIQKWLAENAAVLKDHGYHYLEAYRVFNAHHHLAPNQRVKLNPAISKAVKEEISRVDENIIVSSEQIYYTVPENFADAMSLFAGLEIEVILYVRWHEELIISTYMQWMREGKEPFQGPFEFFRKFGRVFQFSKRIEYLISQLPTRPKLVVRVYCENKLRSNFQEASVRTEAENLQSAPQERFDVLSDFCGFLGICIDKSEAAISVNSSLSPLFGKVMFQLNQSGISEEKRKLIIKEMQAISAKLEWQLSDIFTLEQRAYMRAYFESDDTLVATMANDVTQCDYWKSRLRETASLKRPDVADEPAHFGESAYLSTDTKSNGSR